jgi:hypothetical protein
VVSAEDSYGRNLCFIDRDLKTLSAENYSLLERAPMRFGGQSPTFQRCLLKSYSLKTEGANYSDYSVSIK